MTQKGIETKLRRSSIVGVPYLIPDRGILDEFLFSTACISGLLKYIVGGMAGMYLFNGEYRKATILAGTSLGLFFVDRLLLKRDREKYGYIKEEYVKKNPNWYKD